MEGIKRKVPGDGKMEFKWVKEKIVLGDSESFDGTTMVQFLENSFKKVPFRRNESNIQSKVFKSCN